MSTLASETYDFAFEVIELDGSLLAELLEDASIIEHTQYDNLDYHDENCEDCSLDDMLAELDSHECSESSSTAYMMNVDDPFDLGEMDEGMGDCWYMDGFEMVTHVDENVAYDGFYYGEPMFTFPCGNEALGKFVKTSFVYC